MFPKLQYISQGLTTKEQLLHIENALNAGCTWLQLRFKNAPDAQLVLTAEKAKGLCDSYGATFIMNDHPSIAKLVDADGVHLGLTDMRVQQARTILGPDKIIGGTANTFEDVVQRHEEGCDYVGLGPFRFTSTKEKLSPILGAKGYAEIVKKMDEEGLHIPLYAIGGIVPDDVETLMQTGIYGIAVSGVITHHQQKKQLLAQLNSYLYATVNNRG